MIRKLTPHFLLNLYRKRKKRERNKELAQAKSQGKIITAERLAEDLRKMGVTAGDTLLVHSSMSSMGYLVGGPSTVVRALLSVLGAEGNLLMPSSPVNGRQKEYMESDPIFDVRNSPSRMGAITEYFRTMQGVVRSFHPTEPVCAFGPFAQFYTEEHFGQLTPYNKKSPFYRVAEANGKILYAGVTLDNAGTSLHTLEDAVKFKYPVYDAQTYAAKMVDVDGNEYIMDTKVHNPEYSDKRKCDELLPMFHYEEVMEYHQFGEAKAMLFDARKMLDVMISKYEEFGVTMYTPKGDK